MARCDDKDNLLRVPGLGVNETVPGRNDFGFYSGKLDQRWNDRLNSSLRVNVGEVSIQRQGGGLSRGERRARVPGGRGDCCSTAGARHC